MCECSCIGRGCAFRDQIYGVRVDGRVVNGERRWLHSQEYARAGVIADTHLTAAHHSDGANLEPALAEGLGHCARMRRRSLVRALRVRVPVWIVVSDSYSREHAQTSCVGGAATTTPPISSDAPAAARHEALVERPEDLAAVSHQVRDVKRNDAAVVPGVADFVFGYSSWESNHPPVTHRPTSALHLRHATHARIGGGCSF